MNFTTLNRMQTFLNKMQKRALKKKNNIIFSWFIAYKQK